MPEYVEVKGISEAGKRFIQYTLASGFEFFVFVEEPKYAEYLKSHPSGVTARYHFIEMITEGGHGINRPMLNGEIIKAHPELTLSQIKELRKLYADNKNRRPFKVALETTIAPIIPQIIAGAKLHLDDFNLYFTTTRPLVNYRTKSAIGITQETVNSALKTFSRTTAKFVGPNLPLIANVGDAWLNTQSGRLFFYMTDGTTGGTSGTGMTSAWVEI
jgi:hypothetical protein